MTRPAGSLEKRLLAEQHELYEELARLDTTRRRIKKRIRQIKDMITGIRWSRQHALKDLRKTSR